MNDAKVSVVIPCFNLGSYLDEAVDSVLAQTFQDFEIVVVDDGSTDEQTRRLLSDYRKPRTRVIRSENRGLPAAKNLGLAQTTGPYVCMLDADDRLDPALLEKSVAALDGDPSVAFVSHWLRTFGDETWEWKPTRCDAPSLLDVNTVNGAALVRRTALEAVGGFDESMRDGCEDWDLWIGLVERGFKGRILPEVLFHYRRRPESMSRTMMRGEGHPRLYQRLAAKHSRIYGDHVAALVVRREEDISNLRRHIHDLELEQYGWLGPELAKWRDDVETLERKAADAARRQAGEAAQERAQAALEQAERRFEDAERRFEQEQARAQAALEESERRFEQEQARAQAALEESERRFEQEQARAQAALDESERRLEQEHVRLQAALEDSEQRLQEQARLQTELQNARVAGDEERRRADAVTERARADEEESRAEHERLRVERDGHERAFTAAHARALELDASFNRAHAEVEALRRSFSWRITAPIRALYRLVRRPPGSNRS
jgi:glycosyltransferase involved in cell wall biosynthesis